MAPGLDFYCRPLEPDANPVVRRSIPEDLTVVKLEKTLDGAIVGLLYLGREETGR